MGSKGENTTTQKTAPDPAAMAAYQSLMQRAQGVANTPYQAYAGNLTAGVNAQQNLGIGNINTASQAGSPWFDYAASMAHPISQSDIERYQNPYTQHVVDATQAQFDRSNAQQQEGLKAREISQGALGGSRARISAADMGYQQQQGQAPVIAGLYNQSYNQALTAAQQQQQAGFQGAGVGANIQQAGLQGAGAQIGAGTLQQQAEQAALSAQYGQYQQAQAFPYQQTQWLAGVDTGVGSQMGGTSTTTAPAPSLFGQLAGVGTAAAGAYLGARSGTPSAWRGGGVGYDAGGSVGSDPYGGVGWIPQMKISGGHGAPSPPGAFQPPKSNFDPSKLAFPRSGVGAKPDYSGGLPGGDGFGGEAAPLGGASPEEAAAAGSDSLGGGSFMSSFMPEGLGAGLEGAGSSIMSGLGGVGSSIMSALPEGIAEALPFLAPALKRGGAVRGYQSGGAPGGDPEPYYPYGDTDQAYDEDAPAAAGVGAAPSPESPQWLSDAVGGVQNALSGNRGSFPTLSSRPSPDAGAAFMKPRAPAGVAPPPAYDDMAYDDSRAPAAGVGAAPPSRSGGFDWSPLSMPLMAAGLGMMASRSPHPGVAIGEGGLAGLGAYAEQKRQTAEQGLAEKKQALDARRLDQMAQQSREHLALQTRQADETSRYHRDVVDARRGVNDRENSQYIGNNDDGFPVYLDRRSGKETIGTTKLQAKMPAGYVRNPDGTMSPIKGGPQDPEHVAAVAKAKTTGGTLPDETADWLAERIVAGDPRALTNLGRGAQGPDNIIKVQSLAAKKASERGMNANDILAKVAEQSGLTAQQRTFGTQVARMAVNSTEAEGAIHQGLEVSKQVPRTRFVPINRLLQMAESSISDPDLLEFRAANLAIINTYARAISPTGSPTVHDKEEAMKIVSEATSPEAYERVMNRMLKEIAIAHAAPTKAKEELERIRKSGSQPGGAPAPAVAAPAAPDQNAAAREWLAKNPNDPRAASVRQKLGIQ